MSRSKYLMAAPDGVREGAEISIEGSYYWTEADDEGRMIVTTTNPNHVEVMKRHGYTPVGEIAIMPAPSNLGIIDFEELGRTELAQALRERGVTWDRDGGRQSMEWAAQDWNDARKGRARAELNAQEMRRPQRPIAEEDVVKAAPRESLVVDRETFLRQAAADFDARYPAKAAEAPALEPATPAAPAASVPLAPDPGVVVQAEAAAPVAAPVAAAPAPAPAVPDVNAPPPAVLALAGVDPASLDPMSYAQIKAFLTAHSIAYTANTAKTALIDLGKSCIDMASKAVTSAKAA